MTREERPRYESGDGGESRESLESLLADPHVRHTLSHLKRVGSPEDTATLATHVAAGITDTPPEDVPSGVEDRVQTFLTNGHLPALARHGIVEYDREANTVALV